MADSIVVTDLHPSGATSSYAFGVHGSQQVGYTDFGGGRHAALWSNTPASVVDLHPSGTATGSVAEATSGLSEAGYTIVPANKSHAAMWSGAANSFIDLHPASLSISAAHAVTDSQQFGVVNGGTIAHAAFWSATSAYVDLNPVGQTQSVILGAISTQQVGYQTTNSGILHEHAALWTGSLNSVVDLHPAGADNSFAYATSGSQQVGYGSFGGTFHALLWSGNAASVVDLSPPGASSSTAFGVSASHQAGVATFAGTTHAILWSGSSNSFVDLHNALNSGFTNSLARGAWEDATGVYVVGYAQQGSSGNKHAMLWKVSPSSSVQINITDSRTMGASVILSLAWTNNGAHLSLQGAAALVGPWGPVQTSYTTNANWVSAAVTSSIPAQFYRLRSN